MRSAVTFTVASDKLPVQTLVSLTSRITGALLAHDPAATIEVVPHRGVVALVDVGQERISVPGSRQELTPRQNRLLWTLYLTHGQSASQSDLQAALGMQTPAGLRALVYRTRLALRPAELIDTTSDGGYRWAPSVTVIERNRDADQ